MLYKEFGKTKEKLSVICMGTWVLGGKNFGPVAESDAIAAVHAMIDNGVNFIDTAPIYAVGGSEAVLGKALKGRRDRVFLVSKFGSFFKDPNDTSKGTVRDSRPAYIRRAIEESLTRLQTDYLDGYLIHWPDSNTPLEDTVACLKELQQAGKVRYIGMSNLDLELADYLLGIGGLDIVQYPYSMVDRRKEDLLRRYAAAGCGTMGYASLGGGILTGAFRQIPQLEDTDMRNSFYGPIFHEPGFSQIMLLLEEMDEIAAQRQVPLAQIAINWGLAHDYLHAALVGVRNVEEANENCAAATWQLNAEELARLDAAVAKINVY